MPDSTRKCNVPGCQMRARVSGLCIKHYRRAVRLPAADPARPAADVMEGFVTPDEARRVAAGGEMHEMDEMDEMKTQTERKPDMSDQTKTCNVPGCDKPVQSRGICSMHWHRAFKGHDGPQKDEALAAADAPKRKGRGDKPPAAAIGKRPRQAPKAATTPTPPAAHAPPEERGSVAALRRFCAFLDLPVDHVRVGADDLFMNRLSHRMVIVDAAGVLRRAKIVAGE